MKKIQLIICLTILCMLTGCGRENTPDSEILGSEPESANRVVHTAAMGNIREIVTVPKDSYEFDVLEFDIADKEYAALSGKKMPYKIRGVMGVPKGEGTFPLVLITHGSHSNEDETLRFDTGFTYLVQKLAQNGYIAVSMDMSKPYIWKYGDNDDKEKSLVLADEHIKSLLLANEGNAVGYPLDLTAKIDFNKVALIGHSRGGDTIFDIALMQQENGIPISALLSIAPTQPVDLESRLWPACETSILVPEYDGDVISLDGFMFDSVLNIKSEKNHSVTFLKKANHNYFNKNIQGNDAEMVRSPEQLKDQLTREQQQQFLEHYAVFYMNTVFSENLEDSLHTFQQAQPNKMFGFDVLTRLNNPNEIILSDSTMIDSFITEGAEIKEQTDSWFYQDDQVLLDTVTFGNDAYKTKQLLQVKWHSLQDAIHMTPAIQDFSKHDALSFAMVTDSADSANTEAVFQSFSIELKDKAGNTSLVTLKDTLESLRITEGKLDVTPLGETDYHFWTPITPIGHTRIPLSLFEGIDLKQIDTISIQFDQTKQGSLYLESVLLQ